MQAGPPRPLIDAGELAALLADERCTVLDVRYQMGGPSGPGEYAAGHVPGAAYVDLDTALAGPPGERGRHPLPDVAVFEEAMRAAGVSDDRPVVVYDDWAGRAAARCWWLLRWAGHQRRPRARRRLVGLAAGRGTRSRRRSRRPAAGRLHRPTRAAAGPGARRGARVREGQRARRRARPRAVPRRDRAGRPRRRPHPRRGQRADRRQPRRGRAVPHGRGARRGLRRGEGPAEVAAYCGSGVTAAHDVLAMAVAGIDAALYPGSWSEWVADPERPVATGE